MATVTSKPGDKKKSKAINQHSFRALHQAAAAPPDEDDEIDTDPEMPAAADQDSVPRQLALFVYIFIYNCAFTLLYFTFATFNEVLARLRRRPEGRPLRVLRMSTMIAQGGVAKVALQTVLTIPAEQVRTRLLVFGGKQAVPPSLAARHDIERLNYKLVIWPGAYKLKTFRHIFKLARIILRSHPDLIHLHEPQFAPGLRIAAALSGGRTIVVHMHNDYNVRHEKEDILHRCLQKHALRRMRLIACSKTIFDAAVAYVGLTRHSVTLIEDGADDRPDCPPDERLAADLAAAAGERRILAKMAHLVPHKRVTDFMAACRVLQDEGYPVFCLLMCYGKEKAEPLLREKFDAMFAPEEGEFLFRVHAPQHLLNQVAVGVTTSELEGLGLNVLEYQVQGVPVAATDLIPHKEMITDGVDGMLFPVHDVASLVRILKRLLADEGLCRKIGEAGRQRALARKWTETGRRTVEFYKSVLGGK